MDQQPIWKKVLWAIDPLLAERDLQETVAWAIRALTKDSGTQIEPVYVMNRFPRDVPLQVPAEVVRQAQEAGQEELDRFLTQVKLQNLLPLKVFSSSSTGLKGATETLVDYARETDAGLIVLNTHAKMGIERWIRGSFAETLIRESEIPLFIVNPSCEPVNGFEHILFPTDFSKESCSTLDRVIDLAKALRADITIFHQVPFLVNPGVQVSLVGYPAQTVEFDREVRASQDEATRMAERIKANGVEAHTFVDYEFRGSPSDAILTFARREHFVIAMAARSGRISASLLGSTASRVVRESRYPVWIVHPEREAGRGRGKAGGSGSVAQGSIWKVHRSR